jgi:hypothetical protein
MGPFHEPLGREGGVVGRYPVTRWAKSSETRYRRRQHVVVASSLRLSPVSVDCIISSDRV